MESTLHGPVGAKHLLIREKKRTPICSTNTGPVTCAKPFEDCHCFQCMASMKREGSQAAGKRTMLESAPGPLRSGPSVSRMYPSRGLACQKTLRATFLCQSLIENYSALPNTKRATPHFSSNKTPKIGNKITSSCLLCGAGIVNGERRHGSQRVFYENAKPLSAQEMNARSFNPSLVIRICLLYISPFTCH